MSGRTEEEEEDDEARRESGRVGKFGAYFRHGSSRRASLEW
jgi:hypothetical protein